MSNTLFLQRLIQLTLIAFGGTLNVHNISKKTSNANAVFYSKVSANRAQKIYSTYSKQVRKGDFSASPCSESNETLLYLRINQGEVKNYLKVISDQDLPEINTNYASVRFYPCMAVASENRFIIAYTTQSRGRRHKDKPDSYYLITFPGTINWCDLYDVSSNTDKKRVQLGHYLCNPDCPDTDQSLDF